MKQKGVALTTILLLMAFLCAGFVLYAYKIENTPSVSDPDRTVVDQTIQSVPKEQQDAPANSPQDMASLDTGANTKADDQIPATQKTPISPINTNFLDTAETIVEEISEKPDSTKEESLPPPLIVEEEHYVSNSGGFSADQIVFYTNKEREEGNMAPFAINEFLVQAATAKVAHMFDEQYFEHIAPNGEGVVHWVGLVGYEYIIVGENLALGNFKDEESMVQAWMDSPGHRANILKESYEEIGVAVGYGEFNGDEVWLGVQIFAVPSSSCPETDKKLLITIEAYRTLLDEIQNTLDSIYPAISTAQPASQEEYDEYLALVEQYNLLVAQHQDIAADLQSGVQRYNEQVRAYNTCISNK